MLFNRHLWIVTVLNVVFARLELLWVCIRWSEMLDVQLKKWSKEPYRTGSRSSILGSSNSMITEQSWDPEPKGNLCRCTGYRPIIQGFKLFSPDDGNESDEVIKTECAMGDACCKKGSQEGPTRSCSTSTQKQETKSKFVLPSGRGRKWAILLKLFSANFVSEKRVTNKKKLRNLFFRLNLSYFTKTKSKVWFWRVPEQLGIDLPHCQKYSGTNLEFIEKFQVFCGNIKVLTIFLFAPVSSLKMPIQK